MKVAVTKARETFKYAGSQCWCHYAVKDGEVWRRCYGQHTGFSMFWDQTLLWLASRARLPDLELLVNLGDWPLVKPKYKGIPMFSWCGSKETSDMVFPTYELTEASLECMGRQSLDTLAALGRNKVPWSEKTEKLFWRGRDSRQERLDLVKLAKKHPESMNASITAFFFFREQEKDLGKQPYVSFFDFFNYKYQMNIDGTVAAYRLPFLLAGRLALIFFEETRKLSPQVGPWSLRWTLPIMSISTPLSSLGSTMFQSRQTSATCLRGSNGPKITTRRHMKYPGGPRSLFGHI